MSAKISATIIDGKTIAADLRAAVKAETQRLRAAHGILPGLAVVLVDLERGATDDRARRSANRQLRESTTSAARCRRARAC